MHLPIILWSVFAAWRWADCRNWKQYHATLLFMPLGTLMYGLLVNDKNFYLWRYQSDYLFSEETADTFYTLVVFPATVLLYLSNDPDSIAGKIVHTLKYVAIYCIIEWIGLKFGAIKHDQGWTMYWSVLFNTVTFSMLRLHYKRPIAAYILSIIFSILLLLYFDVPLTDQE